MSFAALQEAGFERGNPDPDAPTVPHMIEFDSRSRYAFIAATSGASTIVIDARLKEVVAVVPTGAGSHMAAVTPDDSAVWTAAIGAQQMVEIPLDLDAADPTFAVGRVLSVPELLAPVEEANPDWRPFPAPEPDPESFAYASYAPVCHQYSPDSTEAWITLGPGWAQGALFVLGLDEGEVTAAWDPAEVHANCGISVTEDRAVANWSGAVVPDADTPGEWYVFDRTSKELVQTHSAARGEIDGLDAHGLRLTPDGARYWQVNRASDDGLRIDASSIDQDTFAAQELPDVGDAPDIIDFAPDGSLVYISQRGPNPRSGAPHAATGTTSGALVVDAETFEAVGLIEPPTVLDADGEVSNDIHGVAVRPTGPRVHGNEECPVAPVPDADFTDRADIPAVHVDNVDCAAAMDIVRGFADGEFKPRLPVTRAQMASYIFRTLQVADIALPAAGERFLDVGEGSAHDQAIHRLAAAGIVEGGPEGLDAEFYGPQLLTRRDQMASFLMRAAGFALEGDPDFSEDGSGEDPAFPDVPPANTRYGNVNAANDIGIAQGFTDGTYRPDLSTRRDQMSSFMVRLLHVLLADGNPPG